MELVIGCILFFVFIGVIGLLIYFQVTDHDTYTAIGPPVNRFRLSRFKTDTGRWYYRKDHFGEYYRVMWRWTNEDSSWQSLCQPS
jgi:hypothetical protein